jgi:hypothetical protein
MSKNNKKKKLHVLPPSEGNPNLIERRIHAGTMNSKTDCRADLIANQWQTMHSTWH